MPKTEPSPAETIIGAPALKTLRAKLKTAKEEQAKMEAALTELRQLIDDGLTQADFEDAGVRSDIITQLFPTRATPKASTAKRGRMTLDQTKNAVTLKFTTRGASFTLSEADEALGASKATVQKALDALCEDGTFELLTAGGRGRGNPRSYARVK